ncbi:endolytic transglycosylase MltG [Streptomyces ficellus]|uniref:Endolytic murein transglycosylase n=1 Tax=Streptomyces ficellus TaxID=1977088 RepID=A0A6I6FVE2_9ACTN|nr:endolytic transglycosylase MltG [Streptomyces ficellus]QGV81616.1 endolytic transglycosylase MltG [Streptomyces ficellus]
MTEYGRSPGSEPWHPEDPAHGHQGWEGQQAYYQQTQYGDGHQQDPYQQQSQQGYGDEQYHAAQDYHAQQAHAQQAHAQQIHAQQAHQQQVHAQQAHAQQQQAHAQQAHAQQTYGGQGYAGQPYDTGGWDTGQQTAMPYGAHAPGDPYGTQGPDLYGTPEAYPPPQPPGQRRAEPEPVREEPQPEPEEETHPFFSDGAGDDDGDDDHDEPGGSRHDGGKGRRGGGKPQKKRKSRNGLACLVVALVMAGGAGGVGYFGYQFWQGRFGAAPDYAGEGTSETVQVEIPKGAGGYEIAALLVEQGVVKSQGAFVSAQEKNPDGKSIQDGVYTLKKGMSAASAVEAMLNPENRNALTIPEGKRSAFVYAQIDKKLELKAGTTESVAKAKAKNLGLPAWATNHPDLKDPLEGFLFPASYPVAKGAKPEDILKKMVARANAEYTKLDIETKATSLGLKSPWELLTIASLVQVEGKYPHDFDKVSRVVYNRLKPNNVETVGRLEFDSTINYIKEESTLDVGTVADLRKIDDPYNTYDIKGLTPGPISNPGVDAIKSAINPTPGPWYYFVSINEDKTVFSVTNEEHNRNVEQYEKEREKSGQ